MNKYMVQADVIKALTHPFLSVMLLVGWITMILSGTDIPVSYEGASLAVVGSWAGKRTYKQLSETAKKRNGGKE